MDLVDAHIAAVVVNDSILTGVVHGLGMVMVMAMCMIKCPMMHLGVGKVRL